MRTVVRVADVIRAPRTAVQDRKMELAFAYRDAINSLVDRYVAPRLREEEIEAWAARYRMTPRAGMAFVEYLLVHGVGSMRE